MVLHWLFPTGGKGRGEGRAPPHPAAARHGRRGRGSARGEGQGDRCGGRDEGLGRTQGGIRHNLNIAGSTAAEVPPDPHQHFRREELHHHLPPANRDAQPDQELWKVISSKENERGVDLPFSSRKTQSSENCTEF